MSDVKFPKRAIHLDFHTMPGIYDVGKEFNAKEFAKTLKDVGAEYINVFARCNLGFAYYPTKIGTVHPSLKIDMLGQMVEACHKNDIQVIAYFNAGLDHEHALRHREWCKVNKEGQIYRYKEMGHGFRLMCMNSGYRQHLLGMVKEVLERYPVDGLFLDCLDLSPCHGVECLEDMKRRKMDFNDERQGWAHQRLVTEEMITEAKQVVSKAVDRKINLFFNGMPYQHSTHAEIEVLPTDFWGYETLPYLIRYARTLDKPYITMTGRFHKGWGDFGGIRPYQSLLYDCYYSVANGGACSVGDHMPPRGKLEPAVYDMIGKAFSQVEKLDPWTENANPQTEIAVLSPLTKNLPSYDQDFEQLAKPGVIGATRMLIELKYQFDVVDGSGNLSKYKVLVLPDHVPIDDPLKKKLQAHLKKGGYIISSSEAGLNPQKTGFALDDYQLEYLGDEPHHYTFFTPAKEVREGVPEMPITIYSPGVAIKPKRGAKVLAKLYKSYFNHKSWDGFHENLYLPVESELDRPALVRSGNIFHFSFPVFGGYNAHAVLAYRTLVGHCLNMALPEPMLRVDNFPSFGQATVTAQGNRKMVHLLTYLPELRGTQMQIIEEPICANDVEVSLKVDRRKIKNVYLAPSNEPVDFRVEGAYVKATVPQVKGYQMVVFE